MPEHAPGVRLGGADLGRLNHVCAVLEESDEAANVLMPFLLDGLVAGDRVIHVVERPEEQVAWLEKVIDVWPAIASGQLVVRAWDETYLLGGRFSGSRMAAYYRRALRHHDARRFRATRVIADMGWAQDDVPGVDALAAYESDLDRILARPSVAVVCAYERRRHTPRRITDVVAAHLATVIGGRLDQSRSARRSPTPRERILATASVLFAERGTIGTGVDTLIEAASVAKATFYRHFPSKDALILAWLEDPRTRWFDQLRSIAESRAATPGEVLERFFDAVADWLEASDFVGCPYLNFAIEMSDSDHPARKVVDETLAEIGDFLESQVVAAGRPDAARRGQEIHALLAGAIALGVANRTGSYALAAGDAAVRLLEA